MPSGVRNFFYYTRDKIRQNYTLGAIQVNGKMVGFLQKNAKKAARSLVDYSLESLTELFA